MRALLPLTLLLADCAMAPGECGITERPLMREESPPADQCAMVKVATTGRAKLVVDGDDECEGGGKCVILMPGDEARLYRPNDIGETAAEVRTARLGAHLLSSGECPVSCE